MDSIDKAIAVVDAPQEEQVAMRQFQVTISTTGRPAVVILPADATDGEIAEVCGWVLGPVLNTYRVERAGKNVRSPQLVVARSLPT